MSSETTGRRRERPLVLMVDDVPQNLQVLGNILSQFPCDIEAAEDGERALEVARTDHPDIILLDVMMPGMDGFTVCRELKQDPQTADIPVIFITARGETEDTLTGFRSGGSDYVCKPFHSEELLARLQIHLDLKLNQEELRAKNKELAEINENLKKIFTIIAHDLRRPFSGLLTFPRLLTQPRIFLSMEDIVEMAHGVVQESERVFQMLEDMLGWACAQLDQVAFQPETFRLGPEVKDILEILSLEARHKRVTLQGEEMDDLMVFADREMLKIIIRNLLSNSIKFSKEDGRVAVRATASPEGVMIEVSDNGAGMDEETIARVLSADPTKPRPKHAEGGTGMGLRFCRDLLRRHGAFLQIQSRPGHGTTCWFIMPTQIA